MAIQAQFEISSQDCRRLPEIEHDAALQLPSQNSRFHTSSAEATLYELKQVSRTGGNGEDLPSSPRHP
jgi:hypothetical protein